ncbi:MAG: hypothetical protein R6U61_09560 [Thermoplasmata archaeon]
MVPKKSLKVVILCLLIIIPTVFQSQITSAELEDKWKKTYGGSANDVAKSVLFTDDEGLIITGYTRSFGEGKLNNIYLVKTNKNGYTQWRRTYGGSFDDEAEEIIQTTDGGFVIAGSSESFYGKAQYDFYLLKIDSEGGKEWDNGFGGNYDEKCYSVVETDDGGYLMAGSTISYGARGDDFWAVKTDSQGQEEWRNAYGGDGDDVCRSVIKTDDGNYLLAGYTDSFGDPGQGAYIIKINETGSEIWSRAAGGSYDDYVYDIIQTDDGGYAYVGSTTSFGAGEESFWLTKTDSNGYEEWNYSSDGAYDEVAYSVVQAESGNYLMAGYTSSYGKGGKDLWIVEIDQDGNDVSKKTFGGNADEVAYSITTAGKDEFAVAGYTKSYGAGERDFWVLKMGGPQVIPVLWVGVGVIVIVSFVLVGYVVNKKYRLV